MATDPIDETCLGAAREAVAEAGGSLHADSTAPDAWAFVLVLPAL